jgi:hypothetical protein
MVQGYRFSQVAKLVAVSSEAIEEAAPPPQIQPAAPPAQEPRNNNAEGASAKNALSGSSSDRGLAESSQIPSVPVAVPDVSSSVGRSGWFFFTSSRWYGT